MQDCKMYSSNADSDSEFENLEKKIENALSDHVTINSPTNSYGIKENELIVDLSKNKTCATTEYPAEGILSDVNSQSDINKEQCVSPPISNEAAGSDDSTSLVLLSEVASNASIINEEFDFVNASLCNEDDDERADTGNL